MSEETNRENEEICERLLGWERLPFSGTFGATMWHPEPYGDDGDQWSTVPTPTFDDAYGVGLILQTFITRGVNFSLHHESGEVWVVLLHLPKPRSTKRVDRLPLAVSAAALAYVRSLEP